MNKKKLFKRLLGAPFVFMLMLISYVFGFVKQFCGFIWYGGEWVTFKQKNPEITLQQIYNESIQIEDFHSIVERVDRNWEKPFVTATFGDNWKEHASKHYDKDALIDIAFKQGRKVALLEREIERLTPKE